MSDTAIWAALVAALVVLIQAARDVLSLWIRARHRWRNGEVPNRDNGDGPPGDSPTGH